MPSKKTISYILILFIWANSVNIAFLLFRLCGVVMLRPIIVYEYLLIPLLIAFRVPLTITYFCFIAVLLIDVISQISFIFLFSISEFLKNLQFYLLYDFSVTHYVMAVGFGIFIVAFFFALKRSSKPTRELSIVTISFTGLFFVSVYVIDSLSGKSLLNEKRIWSFYDFNLGAALTRDVFILVKDLGAPTSKVHVGNNSITSKTFKNDSTGNQLLIIMESWGFPNKQADWNKLKAIISSKDKLQEWKFDFGSTKFSGGTAHAELRELLDANGDYRYLVNPDSARSVRSIFNSKKKQGYSTFAIHSFSGKMFQRNIWWKNIGADSVFFMENVLRKKRLTSDELNYTTPFPSLNDEDAFLFIGPRNDHRKRFAYFLTVNTHLPFNSQTSNKQHVIFDSQLSDEAENQLDRIIELIKFFIEKGNAEHWSKILIVGDHMPPFSNEKDRNFYSKKEVPFLLLRH